MTEPYERLRQARIDAGFSSAAEASDRFGWAYPTYSGHENGSRGIKPQAAQRYARAFRVDPTWLLFGQRGPRKTTAANPHGGFAESEAEAITAPARGSTRALINLLAPNARQVTAYRMRTAHPMFGLLPGDILAVDTATQPKTNTKVLATISDPDTGEANTVVRLWLDPWLVNDDPAHEPISVDDPDGRVGILGTICGSVRGDVI